MTLAFFLNQLNSHQVNIADELYKLLGEEYKFVELCKPNESSKKGDTKDYSKRPYLIQAWKNKCENKNAKRLAISANVCVFSTIDSLPYLQYRLKKKKLTFEISERWLKKGIINILSPHLLKNMWFYYSHSCFNKPLYKLCSSAFTAKDHKLLGMYVGKCYKWGYFTSVTSYDNDLLRYDDEDLSSTKPVRLMWCGRFLKWKHPELAILLIEWLKERGYSVHLDMYGDGECRKTAEVKAERLEGRDCITFHGNVPNDQIRKAMREHDIFLFTSDRYEGWGAVANESMSEGCVLVASDCIGSSPYLIKDGKNGFMFRGSRTSCSFDNPDMDALDSLYECVAWLLDHPKEMKMMQKNAMASMQEVWSPENAAKSLLSLIENLRIGKDTPISEGPCSKA